MGTTSSDVLKMLVDCQMAERYIEAGRDQLADRILQHSRRVAWRSPASGDPGRTGATASWPAWQSLSGAGSRLRVSLRYVSQFAVLCGLFGAGTGLAELLALPLPGNLLGMLLLLVLLGLGVVRPAQVEEGAGLLLRHLPFFFIPLNVGLIAWRGLFASSGVALAVSLVGSAMVGIVTAGLIAQWTSPQGGRDAP